MLAAQDAIRTGKLVAITPDSGLTGFWAGLHAEHPHLGITAVRAPLRQDGLRAAARIAAEPGRYRELTVQADGSVRELVMAAAALDRGDLFPYGSDDVVLISRGAGASGLALAQVIACTGAAIAVVGRDHPRRDDAVIAALEQLRHAGVAVGYEIVNPASAAALDAAVCRIRRRFGPVTVVAHAVGANSAGPIARLAPQDVCARVATQTRPLDQLVAAVRTRDDQERATASYLRLIVTFGSLIGRYGLAQESLTALVSGAVADHAERLAGASPGCAAVHVDWPAWSGTELGERPDLAARMGAAGIAPMPVQDGSRLLFKLLAARDRPARSVIHGRIGRQAPGQIALAGTARDDGLATAQQGEPPAHSRRFVERVLVHYPDVELIAEATIGPHRDLYLTGYAIDGVHLLPPTIAIEAMAQVATALTGQPMRSAANVAMAAPIVLPAIGASGPTSGPGGDSQPGTVIRLCALAQDDGVTVVIRCAETGFAVDHFRGTFKSAPAAGKRTQVSGVTTGAVDADELYGAVCFQGDGFRRLTSVRYSGSKSAVGLVTGADRGPWFHPGPSSASNEASTLLLGSAGVNDAALQLVQACVPHRRLMFAGWESAMFTGQAYAGVVTIHAIQVRATDPGVTPVLVPRQRDGGQRHTDPVVAVGPADSFWNIEATDGDGVRVAVLGRLRMRDAGSLIRTRPWPVQLAGCFIERVAAELGLDPDLDVKVSRRGTGLVLRVRANGPTTCGWRAVKPVGRKAANRDLSAVERAERWLAVLDDEDLGPREDSTRWAMAWALAGCTGTLVARPGLSATERQVAGTTWLQLRSGTARLAATVIEVAGIAHPVAVAIMTGVLDSADQPALAATGADR